MKILIALALSLVATSAFAAGVHQCDDLNRIENIVEGPKSYSNGQIKVWHVTTEEPAAAADHVLVFVYDGEMAYHCYAISQDKESLGFYGVNFQKVKASYNKTLGLTLQIPVRYYDGSGSYPGTVTARVDRTRPFYDQVYIVK